MRTLDHLKQSSGVFHFKVLSVYRHSGYALDGRHPNATIRSTMEKNIHII